MPVIISNNFKKKFLKGSVKSNDTWTFTPVNSEFKNIFEHDNVKLEQYRSIDDLQNTSKANYKLNGKYINYTWTKVLDDDDFSTKPMFITKARSQRLKGQKGNWELFKKSNYWPSFSANKENLEKYLNGKEDGFYVIRSKDELSWFADRVNDENGNNEIIGVLGDAIEGVINNTIGNNEERPFNGILDGNGFALKNITITCNQTDNGMVGILGRKGVVRNFQIKGDQEHKFSCGKQINLKYLTSEGRDINCGLLVGRNYGKIENIKADEFGKFTVSNFVPQVYSVTNKSDDYSDFNTLRSKWSDNEDNFFFLNSWCINSPGNICPYVGYFAEGIYAERALMYRQNTKTRELYELPVLRQTVNNADLDNETVSNFSNWFPPKVYPNAANLFSFNSTCSIPVKTKEFNFGLDTSSKIAVNFNVFYDEANNTCYSFKEHVEKIHTKDGVLDPLCYFNAGIEILNLNQQSAHALICKNNPNNTDDTMNENANDTYVWEIVDGDVTILGGDQISFVSGETEWVVEGTPKYINEYGRLIELPLRKNSDGYNVINKTELISYLQKPGVIPLGTKHDGRTPTEGSRFLYETPGSCVKGYEHIIGWYLLNGETSTDIAAINITNETDSNKLNQIMNLVAKFKEIEKTYGYATMQRYAFGDSVQPTPGLQKSQDYIQQHLADIRTWFDTTADTENAFWHLDLTKDLDKKIYDVIYNTKINGTVNATTVLQIKELMNAKLNEIMSTSDAYSIIHLKFYAPKGNLLDKNAKILPNTRNSEKDYKFYWRNSAFPILQYQVEPDDDGKLYTILNFDNPNDKANSIELFATYFANAFRVAAGDDFFGYDVNRKNATHELYKTDPVKYFNNYVWACLIGDSQEWNQIPVIGHGDIDDIPGALPFDNFFKGSKYQPVFLRMPAKLNNEMHGRFSSTFFDIYAYRYVSPRPVFAGDTSVNCNIQRLGYTFLNEAHENFEATKEYYKQLVNATEYYEMDARGFFTTDVNAALASSDPKNKLTDYYHPGTAIINYNNNIQMRSLSAIDKDDYLSCYLTEEKFDDYDWPIYDVSTKRCGTLGDFYGSGRYKYNIPTTLLNRSVRMHDIERAAYYVSPIAGANYGEIKNVELCASAANDTNFVGFIGGLAGKQDRGKINNCSVNLYDQFTYAGIDGKKAWTVKYKTMPFYPKMMTEAVNSVNNISYDDTSEISEIVDTLFAERPTNTSGFSNDTAIYYLKPIFNVGGLFGKIVPSMVRTFIGAESDNNLLSGCEINNVSVNYNHIGNDRYSSNAKYLYNGEDIHNNYGSIAGLIELETNNVGADSRFYDKRVGIDISNCTINGKSTFFNGQNNSVNEMLPFGRFHYIPNEMNTIPATNMSPRDKGNNYSGPNQFTTWTLDYPIITNQRFDDGMALGIFNTSFNKGGIITQSPNAYVGSNVTVLYNADGTKQQLPILNDIEKLSKLENKEGVLEDCKNALQYVITTNNNKCNVSATTRTNIGFSVNDYSINTTAINTQDNFTPAFEVLEDGKYPGIVRVNPSFGSYVNFTRTGVAETINNTLPTKIFDASTVLTDDKLFANATIISSPVEPKNCLLNSAIFAGKEKSEDRYFYYTYDESEGQKVTPFTYNVSFAETYDHGNHNAIGYVFNDSLSHSADGFNYQNNYIHLGESVSNMQIRDNLTKTSSFITHGLSADNNGFGGVLVTDSENDIVMFIDNDGDTDYDGQSWNFETKPVKQKDGKNAGMIIEVK